jgi:hypothetical protein
MSQKEREAKRQQAQIAAAMALAEQARKLRMRPIARAVRAIFATPGLWRNS